MGKYLNITYDEQLDTFEEKESMVVPKGNCGLCGEYIVLDRHHTVLRSHGGHKKKKVYLCRKCHRWVHEHPLEAKEKGLYD